MVLVQVIEVPLVHSKLPSDDPQLPLRVVHVSVRAVVKPWRRNDAVFDPAPESQLATLERLRRLANCVDFCRFDVGGAGAGVPDMDFL